MTERRERDYILGTHDDEVARLGLQHRVWRSTVLECWRRAGLTAGWRVLDVGAGPGYAAMDLAEIVGPQGAVVAVERSSRYVEIGKAACAARGLENVRYHELDLMADPLPGESFDMSWCRWVASFVSSPRTLIEKLAGAVRVGGVAIFHEYVDYASWRYAPQRPKLEEFVRETMASWRDSGGEPDIALSLPTLLADAGFRIREAVPRVFCARRGDYAWNWPASFVKTSPQRLQDLGRVDAKWVDAVREEYAAVEADPNSLVITPMVLEIIAERIG
jgi:SAM-dependent methyltransferase